ncbi:YybS family protein [Tepidibacillus infernus]|uniref:YybS family protein n=1 Tax=Tepidibacillus infernus TaxID=1806172 RepID=UPI003A375EB2
MRNLKGMVEGSIITGISLIFLLLSMYTPIGIMQFFMPIPFIIYGYRHGLKQGIWVILINIALSFFIGQFFGLVFVFFAGTIGIVMGVLYKGDHALPAIIGGVITTLVNFIIGLTISSQLFGIDLVEQFKTLMRSSLETVKNMGSVLGSQEQINQTFEMYHRFIDMIDLILPVLLINSAIIIVLFNHFFAVKIMKRLGTPIPQLPPFREWRFPRSIVYYYILTMIALSIKSVYEINTLKIIVSNLYPILQMLLLAQGLSFLFFLAHMKGFKKGIPIIVSIVAILNPFLSQILIILGMVDLGFHLRNKLKV